MCCLLLHRVLPKSGCLSRFHLYVHHSLLAAEVKAVVDAVNRRIAEEGEDIAYHHLPEDAGLEEGTQGGGGGRADEQ
jgi:hypothetical protein